VSDLITPGAALGVLGNGQLGRMFAIAARTMGYRTVCFGPEQDSPAEQVCDEAFVCDYDDQDALTRFARRCAAVTLEFENIPSAALATVGEHTRVAPGANVLHIAQQRAREKTTLDRAGVPVTPFRVINRPDELPEALKALGGAGVLKTAAWGYDGKGQQIVRSVEEARSAWDHFRGQDCVLEKLIDLDCEVSVVVARGLNGETKTCGPIRNEHANHILDISCIPAGIPDELSQQAREIAVTVAEALELVGVLCVEFFVANSGGGLMVNEIAPRPHNSGHLTIEACPGSQFQQQVRAMTGLPLGDTAPYRPAAMANLLGHHWLPGGDDGDVVEPDWSAALSVPGVCLHLYGKHEPRIGRKMGHLTALGDSVEDAVRRVTEARARLNA